MNCVVTAGPTYEPLDAVRRLTNFSTGQLGTELANYLTAQGHDITLLLGQQATWRGEQAARSVIGFTTTADLRAKFQALARQPVDAVFHAAAVSDFAFGNIWQRSPEGELIEIQAGKISSRLGPLLAELVPTPKILGELRGWFPGACLVGWKYEVDGDRAGALAQAERQLTETRTDACVANGPAYGPGFGLVTGGGHCTHLENLPALFPALEQFVHKG